MFRHLHERVHTTLVGASSADRVFVRNRSFLDSEARHALEVYRRMWPYWTVKTQSGSTTTHEGAGELALTIAGTL